MKRCKQSWMCVMCAVLAGIVFGAEEVETSEDFYVSAAAAMTLPQGGTRLRHVGGAELRAGCWFSENWAVEGEAAWQEDCAGLGLQSLWLLQGWDLYGDLFGYSRFDPFVTLGARGWIGAGCGQVGPKVGIGAFYHLTDSWSFRIDADATLGIDTNCAMLYTVAVGIQYGF